MGKMRFLLFAALVLASAPGLAVAPASPARDAVAKEPEQWLDIEAGAAQPSSVEILKSRAGDIDCARPVSRETVAPGSRNRVALAFLRQQAPGIALYPWNICFVIDGVRHHAWQGYDPGPGASFHLHCTIGADADPLRYLCSRAEMARNLRNYADYSAAAPTAAFRGEPCPGLEEAPESMDCNHHNGAYDMLSQDTDQMLNVATTAPGPVSLLYLMSRTPGDADCAKPQISRWTRLNALKIAPGKTMAVPFEFDRQFAPQTAYYEWNVCFVIDGRLYRAWRGYDPGPGASLHVGCVIGDVQLKLRDTAKYVCGAPKLEFPGDDTVYAAFCASGGCRKFLSQKDYEAWRAPGNPVGDAEEDQMALAVLTYALTHRESYVYSNKRDFALYITFRDHDPAPDVLRRLSANGDRLFPGSLKKPGTGMGIYIGYFTVVSPGVAQGGIGAGDCGMLCGSSTSVTLQKRGGSWEVSEMKMLSIQ